jgi:hypothetical protein
MILILLLRRLHRYFFPSTRTKSLKKKLFLRCAQPEYSQQEDLAIYEASGRGCQCLRFSPSAVYFNPTFPFGG